MSKPAPAKHPINGLLLNRWSPMAFDSRPVEPAKLQSLFEAARWSPSSYNEQPWAFMVATKDQPEEFAQVLSCIVEGNAVWAKHAPVLMITVASHAFSRNGTPNRHGFYDLGQAVAHLSVEAESLGLLVHQMAGFDPDKAKSLFSLPESAEAASAVAIGYLGDPSTLPEGYRQREVAPRSRKEAGSFVFTGKWGQTAPFLR